MAYVFVLLLVYQLLQVGCFLCFEEVEGAGLEGLEGFNLGYCYH